MKKFFKYFMWFILIVVVIVLIFAFLAFSARTEIVPEIIALSDSGKKATAIRGNYIWNSFSDREVENNLPFEKNNYEANNTILVTPNEKITLKNSENILECYKFYGLDIKYYNENNEENVVALNDNNYADLSYLEFIAPEEEGTYRYSFKLSYYNYGEVYYGLRVIVSTEPTYDVEQLSLYKNTSLTNANVISEIINILPYSNYNTGIAIKGSTEDKELVIYCSEIVIDRADLFNNVVALFTLVPDLNLITYKSLAEVYTFTRFEIENQIGRELKDYSENQELWEVEVLYKEKVNDAKSTRDEIYKAIISDVIAENENDFSNAVVVDTNSFKQNEILPISEIDRQEILDYLTSLSSMIYDINLSDYSKLKINTKYIGLISIVDEETYINDLSGDAINVYVSGDTIYEEHINYSDAAVFDNSGEKISSTILGLTDDETEKYYISILLYDKSNTTVLKYMVQYSDSKWNVTKVEN